MSYPGFAGDPASETAGMGMTVNQLSPKACAGAGHMIHDCEGCRSRFTWVTGSMILRNRQGAYL